MKIKDFDLLIANKVMAYSPKVLKQYAISKLQFCYLVTFATWQYKKSNFTYLQSLYIIFPQSSASQQYL